MPTASRLPLVLSFLPLLLAPCAPAFAAPANPTAVPTKTATAVTNTRHHHHARARYHDANTADAHGGSAVLLPQAASIPAEGGPGAKIAYLPSGPALLSGGVGFITLGKGLEGLGLGVGAYSLSSEYVPTHDGVKYDLGYTYGGALVNYVLFPRRLVSLDASIMVGPGQGWAVPRLTGADRIYVNFMQIEPGINIMFNLTRELSVGVGGSWRFCGGADLDNLLGSDMGGGGISFLILVGQD